MIDFLTEYQEVFAWSYTDMPGLDPSIVKHFLPLDTERFPPKHQHLRRQRADLLLRIKEEVVKQVDAGFLEVCNYSEWVANVVLVEKNNGKVRVCIDYRDLNKANPKDNFPLPHIEVLVDNTARHTQFSFMDGFSGNNQIQMAEEDKIKTTFITMWEIEVYVDDMIAKSKEGEDHLVNLKRLLNRLRKYKLRLNPAKCNFGVKSGKLLGFIVSEKGIEVDLDKCQPLFRLLRKNAAVEWDDECQKAFDTVKAYLVQPPVLVPPSPDRPLILYLTNQFADALATLASMVSITKENLIEPFEFEIAQGPAHCDVIDAVDGKPWYADIKHLLQTGQFQAFTDRHDRRTLRRIAANFFLSGETLYRRSFDATLLWCVDKNEAQCLMEEVHERNCGPHMNGLMLAKKLMRLGYFWSTMETDCVKH
ncbi:hypothetical protein CRG98_012337, partial [Punica granatum]